MAFLPISCTAQIELWRRGAESNRRERFCRPLPYHLATAPLTFAYFSAQIPRHCSRTERWRCRDSNGTKGNTLCLFSNPLYHSSFNPNRTCREVVEVDVMTPADAEGSTVVAEVKTTGLGLLKLTRLKMR